MAIEDHSTEPDAETRMIADVLQGKHIAVICKNAYDAETKAEKFAIRHCKWGGNLMHDKTRIFTPRGTGTIEFVWLKAPTGRRVDDFDRVEVSDD